MHQFLLLLRRRRRLRDKVLLIDFHYCRRCYLDRMEMLFRLHLVQNWKRRRRRLSHRYTLKYRLHCMFALLRRRLWQQLMNQIGNYIRWSLLNLKVNPYRQFHLDQLCMYRLPKLILQK
jgi:hypothetical protein